MNILLLLTLYLTSLFPQIPEDYDLFRGIDADTNFEQGIHSGRMAKIYFLMLTAKSLTQNAI